MVASSKLSFQILTKNYRSVRSLTPSKRSPINSIVIHWPAVCILLLTLSDRTLCAGPQSPNWNFWPLKNDGIQFSESEKYQGILMLFLSVCCFHFSIYPQSLTIEYRNLQSFSNTEQCKKECYRQR